MPELNDPEIYQTVLDNLQTGVYIVDRNRRVRFWNEGAEQITGYLRQDVVGRFLRDHLLAVGDDVKDFDDDPQDPINLVFRDGKASTMDASILHKEGYPEDAIEKHGLRGSTVGLLQKPFTHESLAHGVREALGPATRA